MDKKVCPLCERDVDEFELVTIRASVFPCDIFSEFYERMDICLICHLAAKRCPLCSGSNIIYCNECDAGYLQCCEEVPGILWCHSCDEAGHTFTKPCPKCDGTEIYECHLCKFGLFLPEEGGVIVGQGVLL